MRRADIHRYHAYQKADHGGYVGCVYHYPRAVSEPLMSFFEMLTLRSLGRHSKPMAILNTMGYYDNLVGMIDKGIEGGFIKPSVRDLTFVSDSVDEVLRYIEEYR